MCGHSSDRVHAVTSVAADSELMLIIVGTGGDADAGTAIWATERVGARPLIVRRLADIGPGQLAGVTFVGLTVALSAPAGLAEEVTAALSGLGPLTVPGRTARTGLADLPGVPEHDDTTISAAAEAVRGARAS
jgi:4-hydroxy-3-methylbut-2-enyl diphosphate reductase